MNASKSLAHPVDGLHLKTHQKIIVVGLKFQLYGIKEKPCAHNILFSQTFTTNNFPWLTMAGTLGSLILFHPHRGNKVIRYTLIYWYVSQNSVLNELNINHSIIAEPDELMPLYDLFRMDFIVFQDLQAHINFISD